jgi:hypothetical protein
VRSFPADTIFDGVRNFTALTEAVCPLCVAAGDVASSVVFELFQTRTSPSKDPDTMRVPESEDSTSTELTQSSCSKLEI